MKGKVNNVTGGLIWTFAERITAQLVSTLVTIILARILDPSHYGIISIITVFITICNVFVTSGFGSSVVRKKDANDLDFNTTLVLSFSISIVLYIILFVIAPYIAKFYKMEELTSIMRVMSLRIPLAALNSVQQAHIQRSMKFKMFFIATLFGTMVSAVVGITLAISGFGAWALVAQYLTNTIIDSIVLLCVDDWKPRFQFSRIKAKEIYSFGWKVLVTDLIFTLESDIRSLIVGKMFGPSDLAYYDQGKKYPALLVNNINSSINKVMLPVYSKKQEDLLELKETLRKSIRIGIYILTPILIGFMLISKNFVNVVLTEKWVNAIPFIQIFAIMYLTRPLETSCHQALLAIGRSDIVLKLMILISGMGLLTTIIAVFVLKNVFMIAVGLLITQVISFIGFMGMSWKYIDYKPKEQLMDFVPTIFNSFIMGIAVGLLDLINCSELIKLILKVIIGVIAYITISHMSKNDVYFYLKKMIVNKLKKNKNGKA